MWSDRTWVELEIIVSNEVTGLGPGPVPLFCLMWVEVRTLDMGPWEERGKGFKEKGMEGDWT